MPVYEYICSGCKLKFELLRPINQASEKVVCPRCHSPAKWLPSVFSYRSVSPPGSFPKGKSDETQDKMWVEYVKAREKQMREQKKKDKKEPKKSR